MRLPIIYLYNIALFSLVIWQICSTIIGADENRTYVLNPYHLKAYWKRIVPYHPLMLPNTFEFAQRTQQAAVLRMSSNIGKVSESSEKLLANAFSRDMRLRGVSDGVPIFQEPHEFQLENMCSTHSKHRWSSGMDKLFHPTIYNGSNYISILGLKLNHVCKRGPC